MTGLGALIKRNTKLYFKDKGMFFTSLITPLILLVLYGTFLSNVYEDTFRGVLEAAGAEASDKPIGGCVGGELVSVSYAEHICLYHSFLKVCRRLFHFFPGHMAQDSCEIMH